MLKAVSQLTTKTKIRIREDQLFLDLFFRKISSSKAGRALLMQGFVFCGVFFLPAVFILLFFLEKHF